MKDGSTPAKRPKYDLAETFDVVVGKAPTSQRFTVYSSVFNSRSDFFKAARKGEWLADPTKPVDLQNEEPQIFSRYLNCVYFGIKALQIEADAPEDAQDSACDGDNDGDKDDNDDGGDFGKDAFLCSEAEHIKRYKEGTTSKYAERIHQCLEICVDLYLLADRLRDVQTANLVMDELIRFSNEGKNSFPEKVIRRVYEATVHGNPLRKFARDECVYETDSSNYMLVHVEGGHPEFARDVMVEFLRLRDDNLGEMVRDVYAVHERHERNINKCHYHQHNETHPRCVSGPGKEGETSNK